MNSSSQIWPSKQSFKPSADNSLINTLIKLAINESWELYSRAGMTRKYFIIILTSLCHRTFITQIWPN